MNLSYKLNIFVLLIVINTIVISEKNIVLSKSTINDGTSLELVAILHRHGFRTPTRTYVNDPYGDLDKYWPIGRGQLTLKGKQQLYKLGKALRHRYQLLVPRYTVQTVRVNSSDELRCHMSAGALLAGMFPPDNDQTWTDELMWQPIPIHSVPKSLDKILALQADCPRFYEEKIKVDEEIAKNVLTKQDKKVIKYLSYHMGENITSLSRLNVYWSTLLIEQLSKLKLPKWTKHVLHGPMARLASIGASSYSWNNILQKFYGGPMIKEILGQFKIKSTGGNKDMKLFLYSGHDNTLTSVWNAFQFKELLMPDFGAALIFELHKSNTEEYFVKMLYMNNTDVTEPYELQIPNCDTFCKLDTLYNITEYMRSVDWDKDCFSE